MKTQLLCTFTTKKDFNNISNIIKSNYRVYFDKLFVLENVNNKNEIMLTYNTDVLNKESFLPNTISLHRKKETNTLYTVNALNMIIKKANNGILDKTFVIDWSLYENMLLLTANNDLKRVCLGIHEIISV